MENNYNNILHFNLRANLYYIRNIPIYILWLRSLKKNHDYLCISQYLYNNIIILSNSNFVLSSLNTIIGTALNPLPA